MKSKWIRRFLWLVLIAGAIVALKFTVLAPKPVPVSVFTVKRGKVEETVTNSKAGTVKVRQRSQLSTEIGGRVVYLGMREGDRVSAGTLLLRLDPTEFQASLDLSERSRQSVRAAMQEACVTAELAGREHERNRKLHDQGIVSVDVLDQAANRFEVAKSRCEASRAEIKRADAAIEVARANLKKTELRAPFDGVVVQVSAELGEWVTPSPPGVPIPPVIDILDDRGIYVEAPMDETDTGRLHPGLPVRISLDPFPDRTFEGTLTRVGAFVRDLEGQNRTVDIEAEFTDTNFARKLLAGTSADVEAILDTRDNVLRIPTYALLEGGRVLIVEKDVLVARTVKTGLRNWEYVEIRDGLREGERVVLTLDRTDIREGAKVTASEAQEETR